DIPIVVTVADPSTNIGARLRSGASILNVAGGRNTPEIVAQIRKSFPRVPIMASSGRTSESVAKTIEAGANAIVYSPPSSAELFRGLMDSYRPE
ncbi:MAG: dioxygenase, partial [Eggerthellaceae bacterium]|nr:dioxygenase [Eggerthellaceae bacterium]